MDLTRLARIPPREWPPNAGNTLLEVLRDHQAHEADYLLAAELAGEIVAIAIEAGAYIWPQEAEPLLLELSESDDAEIAVAAGDAAMMAAAVAENEFDEDAEL